MKHKTTKKRFKNKALKQSTFSRSGLIFFAVVFAAIGVYALLRSFASTGEVSLTTSLDTAFPRESVQMVWKAEGASSCKGSGSYKGHVLLIDDVNTEGIRKKWSANDLPASGSARSDPLFDTNFGTGNNNQPQTFTLNCDGVEKTVTVNYKELKRAGEQPTFNIHCDLIPHPKDKRDQDREKDLPAASPKNLDPIVFPGLENPSAGHFHEFFGNKTLNKDSTPQSLLDTLPAWREPGQDGWSKVSCAQLGPDDIVPEARNGSAYWPPTVYVCDGGHNNQDGEAKCGKAKRGEENFQNSPNWGRLAPAFLQIYYRNDSPHVDEGFPTGLKVVTGPFWYKDFEDKKEYENVDDRTAWKCLGSYLYQGQTQSGNKRQHCKDGGEKIDVNFPVCWDGLRLDSKDKDLLDNPLPPERQHRDHLRLNLEGGDCGRAFSRDEKMAIRAKVNPDLPEDQLNTLIRKFASINFIMRYADDYTDGGGQRVKLENKHVYWSALVSNGLKKDPPKEDWFKGFPECPLKLGDPKYDGDQDKHGRYLCEGTDPLAVFPYNAVDSLHADYFFGWDPMRLDLLTQKCLNAKEGCKGNSVSKDMPPGGPNCSDGFDNDLDTYIDATDPDCLSQTDGQGNFSYNPADLTESPGPNRVLYMNVAPDKVKAGGTTTITWSAEHLSSLFIGCQTAEDDDWEGKRLSSGKTTVTIPGTAREGQAFEYTLVCDRDNPQPLTKTVTVTVTEGGGGDPPPTVLLEADPSEVEPGGSSTLSWNVADADSCTASSEPSRSDWQGDKNASDGRHTQQVGPLDLDTLFKLTCTGTGGSDEDEATVLVEADTQPPSIPENLRSTGKTDTTISLVWNASIDNSSGVGGYKLYRGANEIANIPHPQTT